MIIALNLFNYHRIKQDIVENAEEGLILIKLIKNVIIAQKENIRILISMKLILLLNSKQQNVNHVKRELQQSE
jgi:hypothetical protein